jgi:catechol 2,3-dioxygenase-like lactoylglutathione lyase family enzyme
MTAAHQVTRLRHVGLAAPNFEEERAFLTNVWGLREVGREGETAYFAAEGSPDAFVFRLRSADEKRMDVLAFGADSAAAVDGIAERLAGDGVKLVSEPGSLAAPGGGYGFRFFDIDGRTVEVSSDVEDRPVRELGRGESIPATLAHVVMHTPDIPKTVGFYERHLGFRISDWLGEFMCFARCNAMHHSIAFLPGPTAVNHVAFEMRDLEEMMRGTGRLLREKVHLAWGPGRHVAGNNAFSYFIDPAGNVIEYTADVERVDDKTWKPTVYPPGPDITDQWGTGILSGGPPTMPRPVLDPGLWTPPPV